MRMRSETTASGDFIIIDDAQSAIAHLFWVVIVREREGVVSVQPPVIRVPAICRSSNRFHVSKIVDTDERQKYHVTWLSML